MKYYSSKFEDYILNMERYNLQKNTTKILDKVPNFENLIIYGPPGVGKYTQALNYIKKMSPSNLKFERKMNFVFNNKKEHYFKLSDIHFEIDFSILGCNAKVLFNDLYYQILDIFSTKPNKTGIILCKNFHDIHEELLENFYSYMQNIKHKNINLSYILITEQVSFIPKNIIDKCVYISVDRPTKTRYNKCSKKKLEIELKDIKNIKNLLSGVSPNNNFKSIYKDITDLLINYEKINFIEFRELLYTILIYNINLDDCIFYVLKDLIENDYLKDENIDRIFLKLSSFLTYYNNNYRPIYHLESFFYSLCKEIHGL